MKTALSPLGYESDALPSMPSWVSLSRGGETAEELAFLSGAALSHLSLVVRLSEVPQALLRARLALNAAQACVAFSGRSERADALRDIVNLLRRGDHPGPAGEVYVQWRSAVERPVSLKALGRALPEHSVQDLAGWLDAGKGDAIAQAATVIAAVLADKPRAEASALILADAALARSLGLEHIVPLLASGLKLRDLRKDGEDLRLACHRAVIASALDATRMASDLARRVARLKAVVPKLRAKGAQSAVHLFLTRDAVIPSALTTLKSDRSARRFCDRLVDLGVVRELTGRDTYRIYGV